MRLPWRFFLFLVFCTFTWAGYGLWESNQQNARYIAEKETIIPRLNTLLDSGYTTPIEKILSDYQKVQELDSYRDRLATLKEEKSKNLIRQLKLDLYKETGDFITEMALDQLSMGDYDAARQLIVIFNEVPELDWLRDRIDMVEAEIKGNLIGTDH